MTSASLLEEQLPQASEEATEELDELIHGDERFEAIETERDIERNRLGEDATVLTEGRVAAGRRLAKKIQRSLRDLGMPDARFRAVD